MGSNKKKITKEESNTDQQEKYKTLKKRMKTCFKQIVQDIENEVVPAGEHLNEFYSDSEKMIKFEGFGDEYYDDYKKAYKSLKNACEQKDLSQCKTACNELKQIKKDCHEKYK